MSTNTPKDGERPWQQGENLTEVSLGSLQEGDRYYFQTENATYAFDVVNIEAAGGLMLQCFSAPLNRHDQIGKIFQIMQFDPVEGPKIEKGKPLRLIDSERQMFISSNIVNITRIRKNREPLVLDHTPKVMIDAGKAGSSTGDVSGGLSQDIKGLLDKVLRRK